MVLVIDPAQTGLLKAFKPWELHALNVVWESEDPVGSRDVHAETTERYLKTDEKPISRASIINFLNDMVTEGVLGIEYEGCKGGQRGLYYPLVNSDELIGMLIKSVVDSFNRDYPGIITLTVKPEILEAIQRD